VVNQMKAMSSTFLKTLFILGRCCRSLWAKYVTVWSLPFVSAKKFSVMRQGEGSWSLIHETRVIR